MNEKPCCGACAGPARRKLSLELLLMLGLPAAVLLAGAVTLAIAMQSGFTPIPEAAAESR